MLQGSCLCGQVTYEIDAPLGPIVHCHCATCRKAHSAAFSSVSAIAKDKFKITRGAELLNSFESSPGKTCHFCCNCGSQIYAVRDGAGHIILRLGCLDTPINEPPEAVQIWRSDDAIWYYPKAPLPEFDEAPE